MVLITCVRKGMRLKSPGLIDYHVNLTYLHCLEHFYLNISSIFMIYIQFVYKTYFLLTPLQFILKWQRNVINFVNKYFVIVIVCIFNSFTVTKWIYIKTWLLISALVPSQTGLNSEAVWLLRYCNFKMFVVNDQLEMYSEIRTNRKV